MSINLILSENGLINVFFIQEKFDDDLPESDLKNSSIADQLYEQSSDNDNNSPPVQVEEIVKKSNISTPLQIRTSARIRAEKEKLKISKNALKISNINQNRSQNTSNLIAKPLKTNPQKQMTQRNERKLRKPKTLNNNLTKRKITRKKSLQIANQKQDSESKLSKPKPVKLTIKKSVSKTETPLLSSTTTLRRSSRFNSNLTTNSGNDFVIV